MNAQTATARRSRWVSIDLDIPAMIRQYAVRFVTGGCDHATLVEAAEQCAADMKGLGTPAEIKTWFLRAVKQTKRGITL